MIREYVSLGPRPVTDSKESRSTISAHLNVGDNLLDFELASVVEPEAVDQTDAGALNDLDHVEVRHDQAPVVGALGLAGVL